MLVNPPRERPGGGAGQGPRTIEGDVGCAGNRAAAIIRATTVGECSEVTCGCADALHVSRETLRFSVCEEKRGAHDGSEVDKYVSPATRSSSRTASFRCRVRSQGPVDCRGHRSCIVAARIRAAFHRSWRKAWTVVSLVASLPAKSLGVGQTARHCLTRPEAFAVRKALSLSLRP